ncbi:MAG: hypothetical protein ABEI99_12040 [Halobaculum sp.]
MDGGSEDDDGADAEGDAESGDDPADDSTRPYGDRIRDLHEQYQTDLAAFSTPDDPPDTEQATTYLREGVGPAIAVYVDARAGDRGVTFTDSEFDRLHETLNGYLELYTRCHGETVECDWTVRVAAELLLDTGNVQDVAVMLTRVPAE